MSPINDIAHGLPRIGKIRLGEQVETQKGGSRPAKLDTFRLTSPDEQVIDEAAGILGGDARPWDNNGGAEFEVITDASVLDVLITPEVDAFSQWYELWKAGGCQRRCDGDTETLSGQACASLCPADREQRAELAKDGKACKATTRVSVVLPKIPRIGSWMLESHGFYAAKELGSTFALLDMAGARRGLLPARLRIEQRVAKRDGKTNRYGVPVLDIALTLEGLVGELPPPGINAVTGELDAPAQAELPAAKPVTSTKKAAARKQAAPRLADAAQQVKGNDPMATAQLDDFRARIALLEPTIVDLFKASLSTVGVEWGAKRLQSEVSAVDRVLTEVEAKQAAAWEDRRKAVAASLPAGLSDDDRHVLIGKATGGATESMKTLTQEQANAILDWLEQQPDGEQQELSA